MAGIIERAKAGAVLAMATVAMAACLGATPAFAETITVNGETFDYAALSPNEDLEEQLIDNTWNRLASKYDTFSFSSEQQSDVRAFFDDETLNSFIGDDGEGGVLSKAASRRLIEYDATGARGYQVLTRTSSTTGRKSCYLLPNYQVDKDEALKVEKDINDAAKKARKLKTERERIAFAYNWTMERLEYSAKAEGWTSAKALTKGKGVCHSYAVTFIRICQKLDIDARYAVCTSKTVNDHAIIWIDGLFYDPASEDGAIDGGIGCRNFFGKSADQMEKLGLKVNEQTVEKAGNGSAILDPEQGSDADWLTLLAAWLEQTIDAVGGEVGRLINAK